MATRRAPISFPPSSSDSKPSASYTSQDSAVPTAPSVPASTVYKLLLFTVGMFTLPLVSYFASLNTLFGGNSSYAGGLAALVANVVLGGYIVAAVREDAGDELAREKEKAGKGE